MRAGGFHHVSAGRHSEIVARMKPARAMPVDGRHARVTAAAKTRAVGGDFELAAALLGLAAPRMVDDQATHHSSGITHESSSIGERRLVVACDF